MDHFGNVVVADGGRARVIAFRPGTFYRQKMKAGYLYPIAGTSDDWGPYRYSGDGGPATKASFSASAVAVDSAGNVLLGAMGRVLTVAERTGSYYGRTVTAGDIYSVAGNGYTRYSGDGGPATSAELSPSGGVTGDRPAGLVAAADGFASVVRVVPGRTGTYFGRRMTAGYIYAIAGPGTATSVYRIGSVAVDPVGNVAVSEYNDIMVLAESTGTYYGQKMTRGHAYLIAGLSRQLSGPAIGAEVGLSDQLAVGGSGNLLFSDSGSGRILSISR